VAVGRKDGIVLAGAWNHDEGRVFLIVDRVNPYTFVALQNQIREFPFVRQPGLRDVTRSSFRLGEPLSRTGGIRKSTLER
jgi:hypothetical protein